MKYKRLFLKNVIDADMRLDFITQHFHKVK